MNSLKNTLVIVAFFIASMLLQACAKKGSHMPLDPASSKTTSGTPSPDVDPSNPSDGSNPSPDAPKDSSTYCEKITLHDIGYEEDILPIVEKYCKMCHQSEPKDWTNYKAFSSAKEVVFNRVFNTKDMPLVGYPKPNDEELNQLKHWLQSGVPQKRGKESKVIPCPPENATASY